MTFSDYKKVKDTARKLMHVGHDPQHGFDHLERVKQNALDIVDRLNLKSELDINLLKSICLLHDIPQNMAVRFPFGIAGRHIFERSIVRKYLPGILNDLPLTDSEKKIAFRAIVNHPHSIPYRRLNRNGDLYTKILQDADSMDYFSSERYESLKKAKDKFFIFKVGYLISDSYFSWGRKNMRNFLNFPELANKN